LGFSPDNFHLSQTRAVLTSVRIASLLLLSVTVAFGPVGAQETHSQDPGAKKASSASASAKQASGSPDRVVIKVSETKVTRAEFESNIGELEPKGDPDKAEATEKNRRILGDDYASVLMLSQQAVANQLDSSPEVRHQLEISRLQILSDAQFARLMSQTKPSSEEVSKYYDAHLSDFDRVKIQRLFIWKVGAGSKNSHGLSPEEAKARAAAILQEGASGDDAVKRAEMFKDSDQGIFDTKPLIFIRGQLPEKLDKVAFTIKPGQWAEAEDTPDHIILVYLTGRDREPLPIVTGQIEKLVQGEKMQMKLDELKKKTGIWMDERYFGSGGPVGKQSEEQRPVSDRPSEAHN
jgi:hypothetical protein